MDDFYTSMKELDLFESEDKNLKTQRSTTSVFVEALVPLNPYRWPAFIAGSSSTSDLPDLTGKLGTLFANLQVAQEYLATAKSDLQYRDRLWQISEDTVAINSMCEIGQEPGSFLAGAAANKIADKYMDKMVETELTQSLTEELNMEIFRLTAKEDLRDPATVRGTGTIRQNVPESMRGDLWNRPKRALRPPEWSDNGGLDFGSGPGPVKPTDPPGDGSWSDSTGSSGNPVSEPNISGDGICSIEDDEKGGFFAKCFGWFSVFGGGGADQCFEGHLSPYDAERLRKQAEDTLCYGGAPSSMLLDIDHPAYNPPMFLGDTFLPPGEKATMENTIMKWATNLTNPNFIKFFFKT